MTTTRIAGTAYDARHQDQVKELARIHTYATRIRSIARKAAAGPLALPVVESVNVHPHAPRHERPTPGTSSSSSLTIAS